MFDRERLTTIGAKLLLAALLIIAAAVFVSLASDVWLGEPIAWDIRVIRTVQGWSSPVLDVVFRVITSTAGGGIVVPVIAVSVWLWHRGRHSVAGLILVSSTVMGILNAVLKNVFGRARPIVVDPVLFATESFSFPSGHTTAAAAFYGLLAVLLWRHERYALSILSAVWVILVGLSRVYLGVHYPSDVVASLSLGVIWLIVLFTVASIYWPPEQT